MPVFTILFGVALIAIGVGTYVGAGEEAKVSTFILQMILGLLAIGLGVGSIVKKEHRKHLMHGAVILAAMGVIVPVVKLVAFVVAELDTRQEQMDALRILLTVLASGGYVFAAVQSFRAARKARKGDADRKQIETDPPPPPIDPADKL